MKKTQQYLISVLIILMYCSPHLTKAENTDVGFAPTSGDVQLELVFGSSTYFNDESGLDYLLPKDDGSSIGLGSGSQSDDLGIYLNTGSLTNHSVGNMLGVRAGIFMSSKWAINALLNMNFNITPKKDFIEGDNSVPDMIIPNYQYIQAKTSHLWSTEVGLNRFYAVRNESINPYFGFFGGFQMARVETMYPYTGELTSGGDPIELYRPYYRAGQMWSASGGLMFGVEYGLFPGFILGFEVSPVRYQYSVIDIRPSGLSAYMADHHNIRVFSLPRFKVAIRY
ncbi:MAG TPA: hypothetical protein DD409_09120 [Bacteroidales bacterium]|nr:hypothetical protein [Bacteroidales bacterium]